MGTPQQRIGLTPRACHCVYIIDIMHLIYIQLDFKPADIQHSSLRTMAKHVRRAMLPGNHEVFKKSFTEGKICLSCCIKNFCQADNSAVPAELDGKQNLEFYWTDPIDDMKRSVAKLQYNTLRSSLESPSCFRMFVPLPVTWPILAWCFRVRILWTLEAPLC
jgi:hypothetical protein